MKRLVSPIPSLTLSPVDLTLWRDDVYMTLQNLISFQQPIAMVFDQHTLSAINLTFTPQQLKQLGISIFYDITTIDQIVLKNIIYMISPIVSHCQMIANFILKNKDKNNQVIFIPRKTITCERVFEQYGVWEHVKINTLPMRLIAMDDDILITNNNELYPNMLINRDNMLLFNIKDCLIDIQEKFGLIPFIQGIGDQSEFIIEELLKHSHGQTYTHSPQYKQLKDNISMIGRLIIIDREIDFVTPLLTPHHYEGLINEFFEIKDNVVENIVVNSDEPVYHLLRDENINQVGAIVTEKLKLLNEAYKIKDKTNISEINKSLKEIKKLERQYSPDYLKTHYHLIKKVIEKLQTKESLLMTRFENELLTSEVELLQIRLLNEYPFEEQIFDLINQNLSPIAIIRIICLYCITHDGLNKKFYIDMQTEFIRTFGYQYIFLFDNLFKAHVLYFHNHHSWHTIKNTFSLITNEENDIAKVYDGYAPLSCRLIEYGLTVPMNYLHKNNPENILLKGWGRVNVNKKIETVGTHFHVIQNLNSFKNLDDQSQLNKIILVCFVGPVTYGEISALRKLTEMNPDKHIIILSTHIVNGNTFIENFNFI